MPILRVSNYSGKGPAPVGRYRGLSAFGSYDMAGNVREWCLNASGDNRYILGGAWNDQSYMFYMPDLRPPMDRSSGNGFRCAIYPSPPPEEVTGAVQFLSMDRRGDKPVSDAIFQVYKSFHEYEHGDLKAKIESSDDTFPYWRLEVVSYKAAYGTDRITGLLFLPKNAAPPYQTVVYFPGLNAVNAGTRTKENLQSAFYSFIIRSGRAVLYPIYKGTYERYVDGALEGRFKHNRVWREVEIDAAKDLGRSLDYLETRPDIDREKFAYDGLSWGAGEGPRLLALEPRLKVGVLLHGGAYERGWSPEIDPFNFAPHTKTPVLMLNGNHDPTFQIYGSQIPLFQILGTPEKDKRRVVVEGGHGMLSEEIIRETVAWLDRYLGPVRTR
jgi:dienelactone hydrolase